MKQYEGRHFLFKYESQDSEFAQSVINTAETMYDRVSRDFDIEPDTQLFTLIICPDTESFIIDAEKIGACAEITEEQRHDYGLRQIRRPLRLRPGAYPGDEKGGRGGQRPLPF